MSEFFVHRNGLSMDSDAVLKSILSGLPHGKSGQQVHCIAQLPISWIRKVETVKALAR